MKYPARTKPLSSILVLFYLSAFTALSTISMKPSAEQLVKPLISTLPTKSLATPLEDEIGGLVIDRSISRFGKEFYREFTVLWHEIKGTSGYNVAIVESVIPRSGTLLWLEINQVKIYQTVFGRRHADPVRTQAEHAVQRSLDYLARLAIESDNPDMEGDGY